MLTVTEYTLCPWGRCPRDMPRPTYGPDFGAPQLAASTAARKVASPRTCLYRRMVKKLMRPRARSILAARPVVHGTASDRHARLLGWATEKAGCCPCLDDCARDDNGPHTP